MGLSQPDLSAGMELAAMLVYFRSIFRSKNLRFHSYLMYVGGFGGVTFFFSVFLVISYITVDKQDLFGMKYKYSFNYIDCFQCSMKMVS